MNLNRKTAGILIALFTGVRIGELCGLQMKDISLTDKTISINKTVQRIYDKKKGESYLHIGPPKTKTSARTIPVPSLLMNIIKKFYTENPNHYFLTGKTKPTEPRTYRQFFSRFLKRNGLQKVKFHEILLAPGDHDHILSGVFNQLLSANPRASRINKKSANNPALMD